MRRFLVGSGLVLVVLAGLAYALSDRIALRLMTRVVAQNVASSLPRELPDGLHVALCGAGSPLPDPQRSGPCTAVIAGEQLYVVDAGSGASRVLAQMRIPQGEIDAVLLTHFHSDHIDGLGELLLQRWAGGSASQPVPIHGPEGVQEVVDGFNRAYAADRGYRVVHHGSHIVPPAGAGGVARPFATPPAGEALVVLERDGLRITTFQVDHEPVRPAVGYRFDYQGRSVVLSGDTKKSANLQRFAQGADLLVHEALAPQLVAVITRGAEAAGRQNLATISRDILDYHTTPVEAAEVARDAGVGYLLYNHIVPPLPIRPLQKIFLEGVAEVYEGSFSIGRDGTLVELEAGSDSVELRELL